MKKNIFTSFVAGVILCFGSSAVHAGDMTASTEAASSANAVVGLVFPNGQITPMMPVVSSPDVPGLFSTGEKSTFATKIGSRLVEAHDEFMPSEHDNATGKSGLTQITYNTYSAEQIEAMFPKEKRGKQTTLSMNKSGNPVHGKIVSSILFNGKPSKGSRVDAGTIRVDLLNYIACDRTELRGLKLSACSVKDATGFAMGNKGIAEGITASTVMNTILTGINPPIGMAAGLAPNLSQTKGGSITTASMSDFYLIVALDPLDSEINLKNDLNQAVREKLAQETSLQKVSAPDIEEQKTKKAK
ncbi:MAG: hypothetical protein HGB03_01555 [Candidatus Yonathbacteria bacterium]|nr:hypothetical protein [Candidatus Yonathbacteria bacterium]NTW47950.1 hypothetical protein [Candidatus Yonathbacteria bacterium]